MFDLSLYLMFNKPLLAESCVAVAGAAAASAAVELVHHRRRMRSGPLEPAAA